MVLILCLVFGKKNLSQDYRRKKKVTRFRLFVGNNSLSWKLMIFEWDFNDYRFSNNLVSLNIYTMILPW